MTAVTKGAGNTAPELILEMRGITKSFPGVTANDKVDLELFRGEVLALLGENGAGKSSLMNVLIGLYRPDAGQIFLNGKKVHIHSPKDSMELGIGMVHQNFKLVDTMTVVENVILGEKDLKLIPNMKKAAERIRSISDHYNLKVNPDKYIGQLSVGEQQRVEILKLIYRGAEILILDEPTAVLTPQESDELCNIISQMTSEGKSAIFITHKMEEVIKFSDWVRVLKKGKLVAVKKTSDTDPSDLAKMMVGREVLFNIEKMPFTPGENVLKIIKLNASDPNGIKVLDNISVTVRKHEILGIAGVAGNGQVELTEAVTGLRTSQSGEVLINGENLTNRSPIEMIRSGVSHIPSDRVAMGIVGDMSVASNLAMKGYRNKPIVSRGILRTSLILAFARRMISAFNISTPGPQTHVKFLSGGNIQKTILAREIDACGDLLVAAYPSRGLDVGATEAVRKEIVRQRDEGRAVLLVSEDLEELISISDRIAVMYGGRIIGIVDSEGCDIEKIGLMMAGIENHQQERGSRT
ncbi:MAG: ABC transporter ATP-binding protein [Spirochaetales bacterium]|nr:ABC transporter ATP-binding protein [Spirochaetales bacterium]